MKRLTRLLKKIEVDQQGDRAVIRAEHLIVNDVVDQQLLCAVGQNEVVQTPADVPSARRSSSGPERVGTGGIRVQVSVTIEKAAAQQIGEVWRTRDWWSVIRKRLGEKEQSLEDYIIQNNLTGAEFTFTFFRRETSGLVVALWVGQIDLLMRTVEVAAADHRLLLVQLLQIGLECFVPVSLLVQVHQLRAGVGYVDVDLVRRFD